MSQLTTVKLCSKCSPPRVEQLSKYFGRGECNACGSTGGVLDGYNLKTLLASIGKHGDLSFRNNVLGVDLWYPGIEDPARTFDHPVAVEVGLMHVRAADDIRIEYDFARNGWVIKQASTFEWPAGDEVCDPDWQEVAFVQAWGREHTDDKDSTTEQLQNALTLTTHALSAMPTHLPNQVLCNIARGQLQAAKGHIEQALADPVVLEELAPGEDPKAFEPVPDTERNT